MELLIGISVAVAAFSGAIIINLVSAELYDSAPPLARWLTEKAISRVPPEQRERYREEWLADLAEQSGKLAQLWRALGFVLGARSVSKAITGPRLKLAPKNPALEKPREVRIFISVNYDEAIKSYMRDYDAAVRGILKANSPSEVSRAAWLGIDASLELFRTALRAIKALLKGSQ